MSQIHKDSNAVPGGSINTLSAENGPATPPSANNFNFTGSTAGGATANGAIIFSTPASGQMDGVVQTDDITIFINAGNQLEVRQGSLWTPQVIDFTAQVGHSYWINNPASLINVTMPAVFNPGDTFTLYDISGGRFKILQGAGNQIQLGKSLTTAGAGGSITSSNVGDFITLVVLLNGLEWIAVPYNGNLVVV